MSAPRERDGQRKESCTDDDDSSSSSSTAMSMSTTTTAASKATWQTSPDVPSAAMLWHDDEPGGQVASSALHWEPVHDLADFSFAVEAGGSHSSWQFVCRARQDGEWVPGRGTSRRICLVPSRGKETVHTSFQASGYHLIRSEMKLCPESVEKVQGTGRRLHLTSRLILALPVSFLSTCLLLLSSSSSTAMSMSTTTTAASKATWQTSPDVPSAAMLWHDDEPGGQVASSALHWEPVHDLADFSFAVEAGGSHSSWQFVCRARQDGEWVPGRGTSRRICLVPSRGKETVHTSFQASGYHLIVLVSPELSANTRWVSFKTPSKIPEGALVSEGFNIVRQGDPDSELGVSIGRYNASKGADIVLRSPRASNKNNQDPTSFSDDDTTEVLVELEPVKYQLTNLAFQTPPSPAGFPPIHEESVVLAHDVLENPTRESLSLNVDIPYEYEESLRISGVVGTKPGVSTVFDIRSPLELMGGQRVYLRDFGFFGRGWGETVTRQFSNMAAAFVDDVLPGTSVAVSVLGRLGVFQLPFTGSLRATYGDGSTITRLASSATISSRIVEDDTHLHDEDQQQEDADQEPRDKFVVQRRAASSASPSSIISNSVDSVADYVKLSVWTTAFFGVVGFVVRGR
ncbi:unnamed protein product [Notodromas monacha]|uniref:Uncharacterized protein n=1 Tax=Notodromas monacha TaxID=399045 RepID=A0A7R9G9X0_9CRUS|nr:unnamed protein product [Notodromas monacha]CAG0914708.1 unnamed protein product [Notodromas monacha]